MTWQKHDAGPTTPEPGPGRARGQREHAAPRRPPGPADAETAELSEVERPRRARRTEADPLPPMDGPVPGGGPSPAETTMPLALRWPAPPARPPASSRSASPTVPAAPPGTAGAPPGWRRVPRPGEPPPPGDVRPGHPQPPYPRPGLPARRAASPASATGQRSSLVQSGAGMAVGTLVSRITGFLRTFVFVAALGSTTTLANAYNNSNTLPNTVYYLMLGGIFTSVVVPLLVKAAGRDPDHGEAYAQRVFTLGVIALFAVTLAATLAAAPLADLYSAAIKGTEHNLIVLWAYFFIPQIFFYGMSSLIAAILNTRGRFAAPMWTPVVNNVVVIVIGGLYVAVVGLHKSPSTISASGVQLLGIGTTLGVVAQTIVLFPSLRGAGFRWRPQLGFRPGELAEMGRMSGWMSGYVATQWAANLVVQNVANAASNHAQDGFSVYSYAWQLFLLPYAIIGISVITALLPRMSEHASARRYSLVRDDFSTGIRLSAVVVVPAAIFLAVLGAPIGEFVFSYGSSGISGGRAIGVVFGLFSLGLVPYMITQLQLRVFYSFQDSRTAAFVGLLIMAVSIAGDFIALRTLPAGDVVAGIAIAYGVATLVGAVSGWALLLRRVGSLDGWNVARSLTRMHLATVPGLIFALAVMLVAGHFLHNPGRGYGLVVTVIGGAGAVVLYVLAARVLRVAEAGFLMRTVAARFGGRGGRH